MRLTIRYFAAARAAAGTETTVVEVADEITLGELEQILVEQVLVSDRPDLERVLARCSYLRDEIAICDRSRRLGPSHTVDVLPPFAGG